MVRNVLMPLISSPVHPFLTPSRGYCPLLTDHASRLTSGGVFTPLSINSTVDDALRYWEHQPRLKIDCVVLSFGFGVRGDYNMIHSLVDIMRRIQANKNMTAPTQHPAVPLVVMVPNLAKQVWKIGIGEQNFIYVHLVNCYEEVERVLRELPLLAR